MCSNVIFHSSMRKYLAAMWYVRRLVFHVFYLILPTLLSSDDSKVQENKKQCLI